MNDLERTKVWDPLVRIFHWGLVATFALAYISGEDRIALHAWTGYTILGLVLIRIVWGFIGTPYARFSTFVRPVPEALAYARDVLRLRARRHIGHNPAAGLMIAALLVCLLATTLSGLVIYGAEDQAGPLAGLLVHSDEPWQEVFEAVHEFFVNLTVLLVFIHVGGVIVESLVHRENLLAAMLSGYKRGATLRRSS